MSRSEDARLLTMSALALATVAVAAALIFTRPVMVPFVLAVFLTYLVQPLVDGLQLRCKMPRGASIAAAFVVVAAAIGLTSWLLLESVLAFAQSAPRYQDKFAVLATQVLNYFERLGVPFDDEPLLEAVREFPLMETVGDLGALLLQLVGTGFLVLVFVIYLLVGQPPHPQRGGVRGDLDRLVQRYITIKIAVSLGTGLATFGILWLMGLEMAFVFSVLVFALNFIPSVGSIIATLLPLPVALAQYETFGPTLLVIGVPGALQIAIGNYLEPRLMGRELELHPVTVLLALMFWGLIWGIVGMVLAVPITAVLRVLLQQSDLTRPVAQLLAGKLAVSAKPA